MRLASNLTDLLSSGLHPRLARIWDTPSARVFVTFSALSALLLAGLAASRAAYPYDVGQYEANAWAPASLLTHFHNPYSASLATHAPYVAAPYGPVYYAVVGFGVRLFGDQFWFFRIVSLAAALLAAWLVFRIASRFTNNRLAAGLGSGLLLAQYPVQSWAGVQRPDLLALALALVGLNLALRRRGEPPRFWYPVWSGLALIAAALTRQTYVIPIVIVALWYLLEHDYRAFWRFSVAVIGTGAVVIATLSVTSDGGFATNLVTSQSRAQSQTAILSAHLKALAEAPVTFVTALILILAAAAWRRRGRGAQADAPRTTETSQHAPLIGLLAAYLCLATVLALLTGSRAGSNINYFIEPLAVASLLVGVASTRAVSLGSDRARVAAAIVLCAGVAATAAREFHGEVLRWQARPYFAGIVANARKIPASAGPMYSAYPELISRAGRTSYVNDFVQYDGRSPALKSAFGRLIASHTLAAIMTGDRTPPTGYVAMNPRQPIPTGVYSVYLYVRRDVAARL